MLIDHPSALAHHERDLLYSHMTACDDCRQTWIAADEHRNAQLQRLSRMRTYGRIFLGVVTLCVLYLLWKQSR